MKDIENCSLLSYNTFGMNVKASRFIEYGSVDELRGFLLANREKLSRFLHIGRGSNLLFSADYEGVVIHSAIRGYEVTNETDTYVDVRVGAGEIWDDFVAYAVSHGWYGAENLSLIPGEVGASAVQNIGAYGVEAKDLIIYVDTVSFETVECRRFTNAECRYAYRKSIFKQELKGKYAVVYVTFRLKKQSEFHLGYGNIRTELEKEACAVTLDNVRRIIIRIRQEKLPDPSVLGNAGSFFMNPVITEEQFEALHAKYPDMPFYKTDDGRVKIPAGWMIERCGWKGKSLGRAGVHDKQALVIVNYGGATGEEIICLSREVVRSVKEKFGVEIHPEVNFV